MDITHLPPMVPGKSNPVIRILVTPKELNSLEIIVRGLI